MILATILLTLVARTPIDLAPPMTQPAARDRTGYAQPVEIFGEVNVFAGLAYTYALKKSAESAAEADDPAIRWTIGDQELRDSAGGSTDGKSTIKIHARAEEFKITAVFPGQDPVELTIHPVAKVDKITLIDANTSKELKSLVFDGTVTRVQVKAKPLFKTAGDPSKILFKAVGADGATVSLNGETTSTEVSFKGDDTFYVHAGLTKGSVVVSTIAKEEGQPAPSASVKVNDGASPVSKIEALPQTISIFKKDVQTVKLTFLDSDGEEVSNRTAQFSIVPAPGQSRAPVSIVGSKEGTEVKLKGEAVGKAEVVAKLLGPDGPIESISVRIAVAVEPTPDRVVIETPTSLLIRRQSYRYFVRLFDDQNNAMKETDYTLTEVKLADTNTGGEGTPNTPNAAISLTIDSESARKNDFIVQANEEGKFDIVATVTTTADRKLSGKLTLECVSLVDFSKIKVDIDPVDDNTVRDTFGPSIAKNYHVVKVQLLNNLRQLADGSDADSILVYGSSFDVGVRLSKKGIGKARTKDEEGWTPVGDADVIQKWSLAKNSDANQVSREFQEAILPSGGDLSQMTIQQMPAIALAVGDMMRFRIPNVTKVTWKATPETCAQMGADDGVLVALAPGLVKVEGTCATTGKKGYYTVRVLPRAGTAIDLTQPITDVGTGCRMPIIWGDNTPFTAEVRPKGNAAFDPESRTVTFVRAGVVEIVFKKKTGGPLSITFNVHDRNSLEKLPPSVYMTADGLQYVSTRLRYRPLTTELMLLGHNSRQFRTGEAGGRRFVETIVQVVTLGVASNLFKTRTAELTTLGAAALPTLFNIWTPDMSENHRAALLTQGMKALEEVPFGAEIVRFVFFPKTDIYGILPNKVVKIESVDTSQFFIPVGVIKRDGGGKGSTAAPPVNSGGGR